MPESTCGHARRLSPHAAARIGPWFSPTARSRGCSSEGRIEIDPYEPALLQPSSVDVRVDRYFRVFRNNLYPFIDVKQEQEDLTELVEIGDEPFILHPGEFVLGSTLERVRLPDDLVARLEGKSSLGRLGLLIHSTAGFIDPGWDGHVTLELSNVANLPITIYHGMKIGQISFMQLTEPAATPYGSGRLGSKYQGQRGPDAEPLLEELRRRVKILVTGGTGFVGHGDRPRAARRRAATCARSSAARSAQRLASWASSSATGDVTDPASLLAARTRLHARRPPRRDHPRHATADFERVMVGGTQNVIAAAREAGVERFVHMSALGDERADARRCAVLGARSGRWSRTSRASGLEHVIFRPSFVFGRDGGVLPTFVRQVRLSPVVAVIGRARRRLQPIWVDDVAAHFARGARRCRPQPGGRSSSAAPTSSTWNELYRRIAKTCSASAASSSTSRSAVARAGARLTERIPGSPLSADQVTMIEARRQRRARERDAVDDVRPAARPARRADPARDLSSGPAGTSSIRLPHGSAV